MGNDTYCLARSELLKCIDANRTSSLAVSKARIVNYTISSNVDAVVIVATSRRGQMARNWQT